MLNMEVRRGGCESLYDPGNLNPHCQVHDTFDLYTRIVNNVELQKRARPATPLVLFDSRGRNPIEWNEMVMFSILPFEISSW